MGLHKVIKCRPSFTKSPSLVYINRPNSKQDIWKLQNLQRNVSAWPSKHCPNTASRWPYISLLILALLNRRISVKTSLIDTKLGDFVNLGVVFLTTWINSCLFHNLQTCTYTVVLFGFKSGNESVILSRAQLVTGKAPGYHMHPSSILHNAVVKIC